MTVQELYTHALQSLTGEMPQGEALWTARILSEDILGITRTEMHVRPERVVLPESVTRMEQCLERVLGGEPVQYVIGHQLFMGMDLEVNPSVLIPRPETASLVDAIIDKFSEKKDLEVLDVGTGSGCIALALARGLKFPTVTATDISNDALQTAMENARRLQVKNIRFIESDALKPWPFADDCFDIIVSNPPYVLESERAGLDKRVSEHEPSTALFVPDNDPLMFYYAITRAATRTLKPGGSLYFEGNPLTLETLKNELNDSPVWADVNTWRDDSGRVRFLNATKVTSNL